MKLLLKIIIRDTWYHRSRISLAVLATVAMSCMIVWLIGSLDLMILRFDEDAENYLGYYHLAIIPDKEADRTSSVSPLEFPLTVMEELKKDAFVVRITPARQIRNTMGRMLHENDTDAALRRQRSLTGLPTQSPSIVGIDVHESPFTLAEGRWFHHSMDQEGVASIEGVLGTSAAKNLQEWGKESAQPVQVGDSVICRVGTTDFQVKIVGLVEQSLAGGSRSIDPAAGILYVPMSAAQRMGAAEEQRVGRIDFVYVQLREGTDTGRFAENWKQHLVDQGINMRFLDVSTIQERLNRTRTQDTAGLIGGAATLNSIILFSSLVSILIVFTALSMGVTERTRTFAMLRAIGMSRRSIAVLVFGESLIMCVLGWIGGIVAGWCVLQGYVWLQPEIFGKGKTISLGWTPILTAGIAALVGSILAAVIPAYRAMHIRPIEGMNRSTMQKIRPIWLVHCTFLGVLLLSIAPFFVYETGMTTTSIGNNPPLRLFLYTFIGLPTQIAGGLLLIPFVMVCTEKVTATMIAALLRLPKSLLASQLSSHFWRTLGTTLALSVGLGVYAFLTISGYSMLVPYLPSSAIPDTLVTFLPTGLPTTEIENVKNIAGIDSSRFLNLAVDQSHFSPAQTERFLAKGLIRMQTSAVVFGIDIDAAFGTRPDGRPALIDVPFQEGDLESAIEKLRTGRRYCLVPDSFAFRTDLHVGDKLELVLPYREPATALSKSVLPDSSIVEYEICGIVTIHGWLWMNKVSGVRKRGYRSGAMLLAPYEAVKRDYPINDAAYFWFDRTLDSTGKPSVSDTELEQSLQILADRNASKDEDNQQAEISRPMVKVNSRSYVSGSVSRRSDEVIQAAARMPLILLAISCFGMMGTIAASIRARRFEFGVLRSLGVTRFGLVRLILAESLLIACTVIVTSIGFGIIAGWCFIGIMKYVADFGSFTSPLTIPYAHLSLGIVVALVFCMLAALFPAVVAGRTPPTCLLQGQ